MAAENRYFEFAGSSLGKSLFGLPEVRTPYNLMSVALPAYQV